MTRVIRIPMKLPSLANARMHWRVMDQEKKRQKSLVALNLLPVKDTNWRLPPLPATVTLTRFGPRMLDSDNLASAFKYVRDQVAREYGVDDGSDQYEWQYRQVKQREYGVEIRIETIEKPRGLCAMRI